MSRIESQRKRTAKKCQGVVGRRNARQRQRSAEMCFESEGRDGQGDARMGGAMAETCKERHCKGND